MEDPEAHQHTPDMQTCSSLLFRAPCPLDGRADLKQHLKNPTAAWEPSPPAGNKATVPHLLPKPSPGSGNAGAPSAVKGCWFCTSTALPCPLMGNSLPPSPAPCHCLRLTSHPKASENKWVYFLSSPSPASGVNLDFQVPVQACSLLNILRDTDLALDSPVPAKPQQCCRGSGISST